MKNILSTIWHWLVSDNPDAPSVNTPHDGKPHNWPVFKVENNNVNSATNTTVVKDAKE